MIKINKKKNNLIRFYKRDLFGKIILKRKINILREFLIKLMKIKFKKKNFNNFYKIGLVDKPLYFKKRTKWCKYFFQRQQFRIFYGFLKIKVFKKIIKRSLKYKNAVNYFIYLMESRLDIILYRLNITKSIRMSRQFIVHGNIMINNKIIKNPSYNLKKDNILSFKKNIIINIKKKIINNLYSKNWVLSFLPNYIEFSYKNLNFKFIQLNLYDVPFVFKSNYYTFLNLMNFYNKYLF